MNKTEIKEKRTELVVGWGKMVNTIHTTSKTLDQKSGTKVAADLTPEKLAHENFSELDAALRKLPEQSKQVVAQRDRLARALFEIGKKLRLNVTESSLCEISSYGKGVNEIVDGVLKMADSRATMCESFVSFARTELGATVDPNALLRGDVVKRRRFDFVNHVPIFTDEPVSLRKGGFVVLEGIHALNPRLTEGIDDGCKFRVFVEPKPTLDVFGGITPRPTDIRFLRRMVRDNQFRKMSPVMTLEMWPNVLAGEQKWIEPFRGNADADFDSYLSYELAVLRPYVGGLLERARLEIGDQVFVISMIRLLELVEPMSSVAVPGDSILRETIGGSLLEY